MNGLTSGELSYYSSDYETIEELRRALLEHEIERAYAERASNDLGQVVVDKLLFHNSHDSHDIPADRVTLEPNGMGPVSEKHTLAYLDAPASDSEIERFYSVAS